jgi:hypothetical protein
MRKKLIPAFSTLILGLSLTLVVFSALAQEKDITATDKDTAATDKILPLRSFLERPKVCPTLTQDAISAAAEEITQGKRQIPDPIKEHRKAWLEYSIYFRYLFYIISVSTIAFSALAAALNDDAEWYKRWKTMAAVLAAITAGANTTVAPYAEFKKFDVAFVVLNTVQAQYITNPQVSLCDLGNAVSYGEAIIHRGD